MNHIRSFPQPMIAATYQPSQFSQPFEFSDCLQCFDFVIGRRGLFNAALAVRTFDFQDVRDLRFSGFRRISEFSK